MPTCRRAACSLAFVPLVLAASVFGQGLPRPEGWKWVTDAPAAHVTTGPPAEGQWSFGVMAPGWHITTRPAAVVFEPAFVGRGRFSLDAETFLFPRSSTAGVGLLIGGRDLEGAAPAYTAFLIRRDGQVAIERRAAAGATMLVDWRTSPDVARPTSDGAARNLLRVDVEATVTRFVVNGKPVVEVARPAAEFAGVTGLRVGADIDLHVTNFDLTLRAAAPRTAP